MLQPGYAARGSSDTFHLRNKDEIMSTALRFSGIFLILYMVFSRMTTWMHVRMNGWQFIVFTIVLALIVDYLVEKMGR